MNKLFNKRQLIASLALILVGSSAIGFYFARSSVPKIESSRITESPQVTLSNISPVIAPAEKSNEIIQTNSESDTNFEKASGNNAFLAKVKTKRQRIESSVVPKDEEFFDKRTIASLVPEDQVQQTPFEKPKDALIQIPTVNPIVENEKEFSHIELSAVLGQSRLDSKDSNSGGKSVLSSSFSPEVDALWEQHWPGGQETYLQGNFISENFKTTSLTSRLSGGATSSFGFEIGAKFLKTKTSSFGFALAYEQEAFVRAQSSSELAIDLISTPEIKLSFEKDFAQSRLFKFSSGLSVAYHAGATSDLYNTKDGYSYSAFVRLTHQNDQYPFSGGIRFSQTSQNTTITEQTHTTIGLELGMSHNFLGGGT
jgi:hypothetical protein